MQVYPILTTLWSCGVLNVTPYHSCIAFTFAGLTLFSSLPRKVLYRWMLSIWASTKIIVGDVTLWLDLVIPSRFVGRL